MKPLLPSIRRDLRLQHAFEREELAALKLVTQVRIWVCVAAALYIVLWEQTLVQLFWAADVLAFGVLGLIYYGIGRSRFRAPWQSFAFVAIDAAFLAFVLTSTNPFVVDPWPQPMQLRYPGVVYFFVLIGLAALSYGPALVLWAGIASAAAWGVGVAAVLAGPGAYSELSVEGMSSMPTLEHANTFLDPYFVPLDGRFLEMFAMVLLALVLATATSRSRRLVQTQMAAERARANLSRYFSPSIVDSLAGSDTPFGAVRTQPVAVLFADIVGFTKLSQTAAADTVINLLREFHGRMARLVLDHGGTVDKYIGDCIMATFGTPVAGPRDASNALACGRAMIEAMEELNRERTVRGEPALRIGIGIHYGPAVLGDIGDERRVEFAVVGDTVNVASRLEALTRSRGTPLLVSAEAIEAARREGADGAALERLAPAGEAALRGRDGHMPVWGLAGAGREERA